MRSGEQVDDARGTFHCDGCGICRVGKREEYIHCDTCGEWRHSAHLALHQQSRPRISHLHISSSFAPPGICIPESTEASHVCLQGKYKQDCPVCRADLFSSRDPVQTMPCGHTIHGGCLARLTSSADFFDGSFPRCPLCKVPYLFRTVKSLFNC